MRAGKRKLKLALVQIRNLIKADHKSGLKIWSYYQPKQKQKVMPNIGQTENGRRAV